MTYERFEDLPVWNAAQELALDVFSLVDDRGFNGKGDLRDQLQRASLSISNNVAEGFERGTTSELVCFLYYARGSVGETRSALQFAKRLAERGLLRSERSRISNLKSEIQGLIPRCESVSRQLRAWADKLQNSDIKGQRHLNDQVRLDYRQQQRSAEFLATLKRIANRPEAMEGDAED